MSACWVIVMALAADETIATGVHVLDGAVNTGVIVRDGHALLIDCCDTVTPERLAAIGVQEVESILCTQFRRTHNAGMYPFVAQGAKLTVPKTERALFESAEAHWNDWSNRWHLYHARPGPLVPIRSVAVSRTAGEGDSIEWRGVTIRVLDTPGVTDGSVSYLVESGGRAVCFCGDVVCAPGKVWDLHSLQKGFGGVRDYHGFLGAHGMLLESARKLAACGADTFVPSHGKPFTRSEFALDLLEKRFDALRRNYAAISALNFYFPSLFESLKDDPLRMKPAETLELPPWVRRVAFTSYAVLSDSGAALLVDCGHDSILAALGEWKKEDKISAVEACWVTHYHDDHVDALQRLVNELKCPIVTSARTAPILEHPLRYCLPCIAPCPVPIARVTRHGESWNWHEFKLMSLDFPGQTLYDGALLVEGHGVKFLFVGDSGAPTGLDDYTAGNRVFLGKGRGSRRCIEILRAVNPGYILNEHQGKAFKFTDGQLDYMEKRLVERERLITDLTPWDNANFATDEHWVRAYPYEQEIAPGATFAIDVQFTNHGDTESQAQVEPVLPKDWTFDRQRSMFTLQVPAKTDGIVAPDVPHSDAYARIWITAPPSAKPARIIIPFRITWQGRYLGQFRHAWVDVR